MFRTLRNRLPHVLQAGLAVGLALSALFVPGASARQALAAEGDTSYTVVAGDNLTRLGRRFAVPVDSLRRANNLSGDTIFVGQSLVIPNVNIVERAIGAGSFNTLVTAVKAAGLVETLAGPGPFTVFAPTDAAFAKLPRATLNALLANPAQLAAVLTYHVVPGKVMAADVVGLSSATSVQGEAISIALSGGKVVLNGNSTVTATDIPATNGVIHVIDTVILPPSLSSAPAASAPTTGGSASTGSETYVVKAGDNLTRIARQFGTTVAALRSANGISGDTIFVGQTLHVPTPDILPDARHPDSCGGGRFVQHAGGRDPGGWPGRDPAGPWAVHGLRPDRCGFRQAAGRHCGGAAQGPGGAAQHPALPRRAGQGARGGRGGPELGHGRAGQHDQHRCGGWQGRSEWQLDGHGHRHHGLERRDPRDRHRDPAVTGIHHA